LQAFQFVAEAGGLLEVEIGDRRLEVMSGENFRLMDRARRRRRRPSHPHLPHGRLRIWSHWRGGETFFYTPVFNMEKQRFRICERPAAVFVRNGVMVWVPAESTAPTKGGMTSP
jgi:hypothetical protein